MSKKSEKLKKSFLSNFRLFWFFRHIFEDLEKSRRSCDLGDSSGWRKSFLGFDATIFIKIRSQLFFLEAKKNLPHVWNVASDRQNSKNSEKILNFFLRENTKFALRNFCFPKRCSVPLPPNMANPRVAPAAIPWLPNPPKKWHFGIFGSQWPRIRVPKLGVFHVLKKK